MTDSLKFILRNPRYAPGIFLHLNIFSARIDKIAETAYDTIY